MEINLSDVLAEVGAVFRRDAYAAVPHLEQRPIAAAADADQDPAAFRVADGVGQEIAEHPLQQLRVAAHHHVRAAQAQAQAL